MNEKNLSIKGLVLLLGLLITACAPGMTLTVLDGETKQPVEGASCIAYWDVMEIGGSYRTAKIVEDKTDVKGRFRVPMVIGLKAFTKPDIKIYKPGYMGWGNKFTFKNDLILRSGGKITEKSEDFKYKSQKILLEKYDENNEKYSHYSHFRYLAAYLPSIGDMGELGIRHLQFNEDIRMEKQLSK